MWQQNIKIIQMVFYFPSNELMRYKQTEISVSRPFMQNLIALNFSRHFPQNARAVIIPSE